MAFDVAGALKAGYSDREIAEYLGQQKKFDTDAAFKAGYSPREIISHLSAEPKEAPFSAADTALSLGTGILGAGKSLTDVFGAGNVASQALESGMQSLQSRMTPERQAEMQARQQKIQEAQGKGTWEEIKAELGAAKEAPLQFGAQAIGSLAPALATGIVGGVAKLLPATVRAIQMAIGTAQGAGAVKGSIYDAVEGELRKANPDMPEAKIKEQAAAAQSYLGKNWEQIAAGAGIGALTGKYGAESLLTPGAAARAEAKMLPRVLTTAGSEAGTEAGQAAQEQVAANIAAQREGFDVPTFRGVAGKAAAEGLAGAMGAAPIAAVRGPQAQPAAQPPAEPPPAAPAAPAAPTVDLNADYGALWKQREELRAGEQTPEAKAAIDQISQRIRQLDTEGIEQARAQKEQERIDAEKAKGSAFAAPQPGEDAQGEFRFPTAQEQPLPPQLDLFGQPVQRPEEAPAAPALTPAEATVQAKREAREAGQKRIPFRYTGEGEPTSTTPPPAPRFQTSDLTATGIPFKTAKDWFTRNVVNRTKEEVVDLVKRDPTLIKGQGSRAKILRTILGPDVPAFEERKNVPPAKKPTVEPPVQPGGDKRGVGVPSEPPATVPVKPVAAAPAAPAKPAKPVGTGLVPPQQPAVPGVGTEGQQPTALTPVEDTRTAAEIQTEIDSLKNKQSALLTSKGKVPAPKSKAREQYDAYEAQIAQLRPIYDRKVDEDRQREAEDMKQRMEEQQKKTAAQTRKGPEAAPREPAKPTPPIPEEMREPIGTSTFGMPEGEVEIRRGEQAELFPTSKKETLERAKEADKREAERARAEEEAAKPEAAPTKPEGQMELDLRKPRGERKKLVTEPVIAPPPKPKEFPEWARDIAKSLKSGKVVYVDGDIGLVRSVNDFGRDGFFAISSTGRYERMDVSMSTSKLITPEERKKLIEVRRKLIEDDFAAYQTYPDGPFTGAKSNVVGTDAVPEKYVAYLRDLTKSLGLGDVRFFLHNGDELAADSDKYRMHSVYVSGLATTGESSNTNGSTRFFGKGNKDVIIYLKPGMSESRTLETLAHEFGHAIERIAYDNAPANVQFAIRKEYEAWLKSTKKPGYKFIELAHSLRNRESAKEMEEQFTALGQQNVTVDRIQGIDSYWRSFAEWFADNTSRWATTADKPLTITEKFFSAVAQKMRDLMRLITGRQYLPAKSVKDFLESMGPGASKMWFEDKTRTEQEPQVRNQFSVSYSTEQIVDSMGPINPNQRNGLTQMWQGVKGQAGDPDLVTRFRTQAVDQAAAVVNKLSERFNGAVRDSLGNLNPEGLFRQAQDYSKLLLEYFQRGAITKDATTGLWRVADKEGIDAPAKVYEKLDAWADKHGYSRERGTQIASRILEGVRLDAMRESNRTQGTQFVLHLKDPEIDQLVREYKADKDLQAISDLMDRARIDLVNHMVEVGRLSKEQGKAWSEVAGYVPFDRLDDFTTKFAKIKKISGKGIAQVGKLPELVGSISRPVGNVFDNYLNTLGWMIRQVTNTDATVTTLRVLEDMGHAKFIGPSAHQKANTVGAYVDGELRYWELPSRYDVLAFKDLNPPKATWLRVLGEFSNILRTTVTALPPFALKQVTDDVQRAIFTSGVKNPGPLIRMALTNFPKLALAELRGIQHPIVREFGEMGLTGEYDFKQGKPADSLLKDLGYKKRGRFENFIHKLDGITRASDLAVRKAIYDQTIKETGDRLLAETRAREFINFRRRGASDFVGAMVTTIPFFNAYAQGMDVLYRAATGQAASSGLEQAQARKLFWSRAAMLASFSMLYAMGKSDDDDYKEMDLRTRDGNWILGGGIKIAVPGELGAIFKVIPERVVEYYKRQGTPEEQEASEAVRTAMAYIMEQYVGRMVPIPQAAKPLLEAWTNYSFLTGRPLEGIFQKAQLPSARRGASTSELAIAIANFSRDMVGVEVSPIMIDNTLRGYFGSTAAMVTMVTDSLLNPDKVDRPLHKWALLSNYMYDPVGTRRLDEFYDEREKVGQANATLNELAKTDIARAEKFAEEHESELMLEKAINSTLKQLEHTRAYRKYLNSPDGAAEVPKDERESELNELRTYEAEIVGWLREAKTEIRRARP